MNELDNYPQSRIMRRCGQCGIPFDVVLQSPYFQARPEKTPMSNIQYRDGLKGTVGWEDDEIQPIAAKNTVPYSCEEMAVFLGLNGDGESTSVDKEESVIPSGSTSVPTENVLDDQSIAVARQLINGYLAARNGLKELGILRSDISLEGDYAEWYASRLLNFELAESKVEKYIDGCDAKGKAYQVKSRRVRSLEQTTSFDFRDASGGYDYLIAVLFDHSLNVLAVLKVACAVVLELGNHTKTDFRFRWNDRTRNDPRVERLVWNE